MEEGYVSLRLNNKKDRVNLETNDGRKEILIAKRENHGLNIYRENYEDEFDKNKLPHWRMVRVDEDNNIKSFRHESTDEWLRARKNQKTF